MTATEGRDHPSGDRQDELGLLVPCCTYRDHMGDPEVCPCPEHPRSALHFLGHDHRAIDGGQ